MGGIYARAAFKIASWNGGMGLKIFFLFLGRGVRGDGREAPRLIPRQAGKILKYRCPQRASARIWGPIWSHLPLKAFPSKKANSNDAWCVFHQKFIIFVLVCIPPKIHHFRVGGWRVEGSLYTFVLDPHHLLHWDHKDDRLNIEIWKFFFHQLSRYDGGSFLEVKNPKNHDPKGVFHLKSAL